MTSEAETLTCADCGEIVHKNDAHRVYVTCCESCGDILLDEQDAEDAKTEGVSLRKLTDAIIASGDLAALRAAVAALGWIEIPE